MSLNGLSTFIWRWMTSAERACSQSAPSAFQKELLRPVVVSLLKRSDLLMLFEESLSREVGEFVQCKN